MSIARAVYADADVYLFDDPLFALDSHVIQTMFDKCISNKGVLHHRVLLLVSNQVQILPNCDNIVSLEGRRVRNVGTYAKLLNEDAAFQQLVNEEGGKRRRSRDPKNGQRR